MPFKLSALFVLGVMVFSPSCSSKATPRRRPLTPSENDTISSNETSTTKPVSKGTKKQPITKKEPVDMSAQKPTKKRVSKNLPAPVIVPKPVELTLGEGSFHLDNDVEIVAPNELKTTAELLKSYLDGATGFDLKITTSQKSTYAITLNLDESKTSLGDEGYNLKVTPKGVEITANKNGGAVYGVITLMQMLPTQIYSKTQVQGISFDIPSATITDKPSFPWRGLMLDDSRYFMGKTFVLKYIDLMAHHKLNIFHWHLIDDAGWRLEIKKYPKLTTIGGFRGEGANRFGGYYTQDDIREVVAYAKARNIVVVPEIEIPAHTLAAVVAYPELACTGKQHTMPTRHFISRDLYCAGSDKTMDFLRDVFDEVCELFDSEYIHVGGDEARYDRWKKCDLCQARMKKHGLKNEAQLQGWMTQEIEKHIRKYGRKLVGWAEILDCGVTNNSALMVWHNLGRASKGAKQGFPVIYTHCDSTYFDFPESRLKGEPPAAGWRPPISLKRAYSWHPVPDNLSVAEGKNVIGGHGCLWTDQFIHKNGHKIENTPAEPDRAEKYVEYLTLPRLAALAEVVWTPREQRDWDDFSGRMESVFERYLYAGYSMRIPEPDVDIKRGGGKITATASSRIKNGIVRYTSDGSDPNENSPELKEGLTFGKKDSFQAATFVEHGGKLLRSPIYLYETVDGKYAKYGEVMGEWKSGKVGSKTPKTSKFEATGLIDSNGEYEITFIYTSGTYRLDIHGIKVLRNNKDLVAEDKHFGFTGGSARNNTYKIKVTEYETGAAFTVYAEICGDLGDDSNGLVLIRKTKTY